MEEFLSVAGIHFLALIGPGQDYAWVVRQSLQYGKTSGIIASLGIAVGVFIYSALAIIGLGFVIKYSPWVIDLLKLLGAGYLFYMGWNMIKTVAITDITLQTTAPNSWLSQFVKATLINLSNVKVLIFFVMVFSTFVSVETQPLTKWAYGLWFTMVNIVWFALVAVLFSQAGIRKRFLRYAHRIEQFTGWLFILFSGLIILNVLKNL